MFSALLLLGGCKPCPDTSVGIETLVQEYNANAAGVPMLWARAKISLKWVDEKGRAIRWGSTSGLASPNGRLLLARGENPLGPHDFVLMGLETAQTEIFRLGANTEEGVYYLWAYLAGRGGAAWYGHNSLAGAPGVTAIPIDPLQLLAVLSITPLPEDFTQLPTVALTMSTKPCQYVLTYVDRQNVSNRILFRRQMKFNWDDDLKKPRRCEQVDILSPDGLRVMTATLSSYKPIEAGASSESQSAPVMPTDIRVDWLGKRRSSIHIVLSEMTTADKWDRDATKFFENLPTGIGAQDIQQVDAEVMKGMAK